MTTPTVKICVVLLVGLAAVVPAQTSNVYIPSDTPDQGACSGLPFTASSTYTFGGGRLIRIPASSLGSNWNVLHNLAFAPCETATWSGNGTVVVGHLAPAPSSTHPSVAGEIITYLGSFADPVVVHESTLHGSVQLQGVAHTWSELELHADDLFVWDGVSDIGVWWNVGFSTTSLSVHTSDPGTTTVSTSSLYAGPRMRLTVSQRAGVPSVTNIPNPLCSGGSSLSLDSMQLPFLGQRLTVRLHGSISNINELYLAEGIASTPIPIGTIGCQALLDIPSVYEWVAAGVSPIVPALHASSNSWLQSFQIPDDPSLAGASVAIQGMEWLGSTGVVWRTSNALLFTLN